MRDRQPLLPKGERILCWFRFASSRRPELGYFNADGSVRMLSATRRDRCQVELDLDTVLDWRPFDAERLDELEERAHAELVHV